MIIAKQMFRANQILSLGWSLFIGKSEKNFKRIRSYHWSDISNVLDKVRINRINIVRALLLLSIPKKVKETLRTRLCGNKITLTEIFVRLKKFAKWKTILNRGTLACYENLPRKTHLKKNVQFFPNQSLQQESTLSFLK